MDYLLQEKDSFKIRLTTKEEVQTTHIKGEGENFHLKIKIKGKLCLEDAVTITGVVLNGIPTLNIIPHKFAKTYGSLVIEGE